jgi:predicted DNA-binding helix-hairpin-helix protein
MQKITKKKMNTYYYNIQELWNTIKRPNLRTHRMKEGAEIQTKGMGNLFNEITTKNLPALHNDIDPHVQEAFQTSNRHDQKRTMPHHIIMKMPKLENKEKILETAKENCQCTHKGKHIRITSDFSTKL